MFRYILLLTLLWCPMSDVWAQVKRYNPLDNSENILQGQGWSTELKGSYHRFPDRAKDTVREAVWNLACNSAGLGIHFYTNASSITVRYIVKGGKSMPHMPATGVSGVDLYAMNADGEELWCAGKYNFGDTVTYRFGGLVYKEANHRHGYEYRLSLPLYNEVEWLEIVVPDASSFSFLPRRPEKPIVVYGTSIAQGACASRPGMAWTGILERRLDYPLVNLGFSGNGRLEPEVIDFVNEIESCLFIVDCMPNMAYFKTEEVCPRLVNAVRQIRAVHPSIPILLTEHDGYANGRTNEEQLKGFTAHNVESRKAYEALKQEGVAGVYYLSYEEIAMPQDGMVDGIHASDYGMEVYAAAYEKKVREILCMPVGEVSTMRPVSQWRDADTYDWKQRHAEVLALNKQEPPKAVILGNSIIHFWGGRPEGAHKRGAESWNRVLEPAGFHNLGYGWDRVENVLWRIYHGELDGYDAERVVFMIGTNNLDCNTNEEIVAGIGNLLKESRVRQPKAVFGVIGILPRKGQESRIVAINKLIRSEALRAGATFKDAGRVLLNRQGTIDESLFTDGLHPNTAGYERLSKEL